MSISGVDSWFTLNGHPLSFEEKCENVDAHAQECNSDSKKGNVLKVVESVAPPPDTIDVFVDDVQLATAYMGYWEWRPPLGFAGLSTIRVEVQGYPPQTTKIRVFPEKLTQERYEIMLEDIDEIAVDLLVRLNSSIREKTAFQFRERAVSPLRDFYLVKEIMNQLEDVLFHIHRNPHRIISSQNELQYLQEIRTFSSEAIPLPNNAIILRSRTKFANSNTYIPGEWMVPENILTYDVYENRLLKHFIQHQLVAKIYFIYQRARHELERIKIAHEVASKNNWKASEKQLEEEMRRLNEVISNCEQMQQQCITWGSELFLKSVKSLHPLGKATQVLLKNPFYNQFFRLYLHFQEELTISLDTQTYLTELAMQKVCDVYEVWSVFEMTRWIIDELTEGHYKVVSSSLFYELDRNYFQFKIRKNSSNIVLAKNDMRVEIKYEPVYLSINDSSVAFTSALVTDDDKQRTPDLTIEVYEHNQPKTVILFDVKYRWKENQEGYGPNPRDKNKMREYRDIICYKPYNSSTSSQLRHIVSNAYILYPGDFLVEEPNNKIGAIPLVPRMDSRKEAQAKETVKSLLRSAYLL